MALKNIKEEYTMENTALRTVSPNQVQRKALQGHSRNKRPIFMWGPPGIGKSDIVSHKLLNHITIRI